MRRNKCLWILLMEIKNGSNSEEISLTMLKKLNIELTKDLVVSLVCNCPKN
jgi:hypothetical protein